MRYTLYRFPSLYGTPKDFNYKFTAWIYAKFMNYGFVWEIKDNMTGEYKAYWV